MSCQSKTVERGFGRRPERGAPVEKPKSASKSLVRLLSFFKGEAGRVALLFGIVCLSVLCSVLTPRFQSRAVDTVVQGDFEPLVPTLVMMGALYLLAGLCTLAQGYLSASLSQAVAKRLRRDLFEKIIRLPLSVFDQKSHGDLMSRMTNDSDNISSVISDSLGTMFSGILTLAGTLLMMFMICVPLTLLTCSTIVLTVLLTTGITRLMRPYFVKRQTLLGELNGTVEEMIRSSHTVSAYGLEDSSVRRFSATADDLRKTGTIAEIISGSMGPLMNMLNNLSFVLVAVFGAYFALKGIVSIGTISAFIIYSKQFSRPINEIAQLYGQIQTALAGAERIFSVLDEASEPEGGKEAEVPAKGRIEFADVTFSYVQDKPVIRDFSLTIEPGKKIALVGATGSGKTTLINLLLRFYEIDSGTIRLDGKDIRELSLHSLRDHIGIVLQDTVLFQDTVRNNLAYANPEAPMERVKEAAVLGNADYMIEHLPQEYETMITSSSLSQGQRQLLAIGRAFLSEPDILILDEATSSVDTRTEKNIQDAMANLMKGHTSLIIAHRLSTIADADEIIVMEDGRIREKGTHRELLKRKGTYYNLYMTQFRGEAT